MRIFVLTSRYTASRDIVAEDFGRQVRLFAPFVDRGHEIHMVCADYRKHEHLEQALHGMQIEVLPFSVAQAPAFTLRVGALLRRRRYDALFASSDPLWGVLGYPLARVARTSFVYDIQDNFELYRTSKLPFVPRLERVVTKQADLVVAASSILADRARAGRAGPVISIPNGVDLALFRPHERPEARARLGLPADARIVAYIGTLASLHGVDRLIAMFGDLRRQQPDLQLVLAGRVPEWQEPLDLHAGGVRYLGSRPQADVPFVIAAADLLVMPYPRNKFTEVMESPYKLMEYYACDRPVVLTDVGTMGRYSPDPALVARAEDDADIAAKIRYGLSLSGWQSRHVAEPFGWDALSQRLESVIEQSLRAR
jgi:glycosyltransferase involved in cell wall biosynthesis